MGLRCDPSLLRWPSALSGGKLGDLVSSPVTGPQYLFPWLPGSQDSPNLIHRCSGTYHHACFGRPGKSMAVKRVSEQKGSLKLREVGIWMLHQSSGLPLSFFLFYACASIHL